LRCLLHRGRKLEAICLLDGKGRGQDQEHLEYPQSPLRPNSNTVKAMTSTINSLLLPEERPCHLNYHVHNMSGYLSPSGQAYRSELPPNARCPILAPLCLDSDSRPVRSLCCSAGLSPGVWGS
jgi:hypothetical protein